VGLGWNQGKSAGNKFGSTWNPITRCRDREFRGGHGEGNVSCLEIELESMAQDRERFPKPSPLEYGGLGPRQAEK
jgi:hypothetical protein